MAILSDYSLTRPLSMRLACVAALLLSTLCPHAAKAAQQRGAVRFRGSAVPGAIVVATQGTRRMTTATDAGGIFVVEEVATGRLATSKTAP